jgi:hypothetical protein
MEEADEERDDSRVVEDSRWIAPSFSITYNNYYIPSSNI